VSKNTSKKGSSKKCEAHTHTNTNTNTHPRTNIHTLAHSGKLESGWG